MYCVFDSLADAIMLSHGLAHDINTPGPRSPSPRRRKVRADLLQLLFGPLRFFALGVAGVDGERTPSTCVANSTASVASVTGGASRSTMSAALRSRAINAGHAERGDRVRPAPRPPGRWRAGAGCARRSLAAATPPRSWLSAVVKPCIVVQPKQQCAGRAGAGRNPPGSPVCRRGRTERPD